MGIRVKQKEEKEQKEQKELQIELGNTANPPFKDVRLAVATQIHAIWDKATVPCARIKTIEGRIDEFWTKKNKVKNKKNLDSEMAQWSKIFDVCLCKCPYVKCDEVGCMVKNCLVFHGITCTCTRESKVPPQDMTKDMEESEQLVTKLTRQQLRKLRPLH